MNLDASHYVTAAVVAFVAIYAGVWVTEGLRNRRFLEKQDREKLKGMER